MTYIYLFKAPDMMYAGQHRCANNKDPMKDSYMGSGRDWCDYLDNNGWHKIKEFRKHVERIILEVIYEDDREKVGEAEKKWIAYVKEKYPTAICNISKGSKPSWSYDTVEEAEEANKANVKAWHESPEGKAYVKAWHESPEGKAYMKAYYKKNKEELTTYNKKYRDENKEKLLDYRQSAETKCRVRVMHWARYHSYPNPKNTKFPKRWTEEDKQEYTRQYNRHFLKLIS